MVVHHPSIVSINPAFIYLIVQVQSYIVAYLMKIEAHDERTMTAIDSLQNYYVVVRFESSPLLEVEHTHTEIRTSIGPESSTIEQ